MRRPLGRIFKTPTRRELEILSLIAYEYTIPEIAKELFISQETVKSHRRNLLMKMDARNTAGLIRRAFEHHILSVA